MFGVTFLLHTAVKNAWKYYGKVQRTVSSYNIENSLRLM